MPLWKNMLLFTFYRGRTGAQKLSNLIKFRKVVSEKIKILSYDSENKAHISPIMLHPRKFQYA